MSEGPPDSIKAWVKTHAGGPRMSEKLLSVETVLEILGISRNTLNRYRREGRIKCVSISTRLIRFRDSDVQQFITSNLSDLNSTQDSENSQEA